MMVVKGMGKLKANLQRYSKDTQDATARGQYAAGQIIMLDAKRRCPKEDGFLEGSGYCTRPKAGSRGTNVEMGFGGPSSAYVVRQHEDVTLNHPGPKALAKGIPPGKGEVFFFKKAIDSQARVARDIIADFVRRFLAMGRLPSPAKKLVPLTPTENGAVKP